MRISDWSSDVCSSDLQDLEHAVAIDRDVVLGELFQDREHHVLLAQGAGVLDLQLLGIGEKLGGRFALEFLKIHVCCGYVADGKMEEKREERRAGKRRVDRSLPGRPLVRRRASPSWECKAPCRKGWGRLFFSWIRARRRQRSEEHTSELQSLMS